MEKHEVSKITQEKLRSLDMQNYTDVQISERLGAAERTAVPSTAPRKLLDKGGYYLYAGPGRKPRLLKQLEEYVKRELHTIDTESPHSQEIKLQVYRNAFSHFIEEFRNYQPLLSAIKKEYENTLVHLQDQINELKPLRARIRLVTEECDRKIVARWDDGQAQVRVLEEEKRQLQKDMDNRREHEERQKVVVSRLQSDLASQYLQYREERDARSLLLLKHSLCHCFTEQRGRASKGPPNEDPEELKLALKVCQEDLTKTQEELTRMESEYCDAVPHRDWDALEAAHKRTLLQLQQLQGDFEQLKSEHDTLLELHQTDAMQAPGNSSVAQQEGDGGEDAESQDRVKKLYINQLRELLDGKGLVSVADVRSALKQLDPALDSAALDHTLGLAFQVNTEDLGQNPPELDAEILLQRLTVSPMSGPLSSQD